MEAILFATIGNRDPIYQGEPTGPLRLAQQEQPSRAILVATEAARHQAEATARELSPWTGPPTIEWLEQLRRGAVDLEVSIQDLLLAGREIVRRHPELADNHVVACFTSGTPQMSIAFTLVTRSLLPRARHFQALDPRQARGNLLREFDPDELVRLDAHARAIDALAHGDGASALAAGEPLLSLPASVAPPWDNRALKVVVSLARALVAVENYQREDLPRLATTIPNNAGPADLSAIKDWLQRCCTDGTAWGTELAACALRLHRLQRTTTAILTAAIASEVLMTAGLKQHGIDPEELRDPSLLPGNMADRGLVELDGGRYRLEGAQHRSQLLATVCPAYRRAVEGEGAEALRARLAKSRNNIVHQGKDAPADSVDGAHAYLALLAKAVGAPDPSSVPTAPDNLQRLASMLR
ncbi:MAG: hypothetical protein Kow0010_26420 [Dehalococcoidia bacterium]